MRHQLKLNLEQVPVPKPFRLIDGYDRRKEPQSYLFRYMTVEEAKQLRPGQYIHFQAMDGTARMIKVNGRPKTWKRNPERVEVPVKYGMYEFAVMSSNGFGFDGHQTVGSGDGAYLLVKVEP